MENNTKLMDKNVNDLTVGDAIKINVGAAAITVAILAAPSVVNAARRKFNDVRAHHQMKKLEKTNPDL